MKVADLPLDSNRSGIYGCQIVGGFIARKNQIRAGPTTEWIFGLKYMRYITGTAIIGIMLSTTGCSTLPFSDSGNYTTSEIQTISSSSAGRSETPPSLTKSQTTGTISAGQGVGVNGYLWRACLDILSFMPLSSADPFGGVVITDWYSPPNTPLTRFKATAYILSSSLQSDAVKIVVFRQVRGEDGDWIESEVNKNVGIDLENTVLARARELKVRVNPR
mgnify:FL=1|tara:strand:- start:5637 stop:6293 length:657 start_codon:yes stop_codon:yes gene_type:complete